MVAIDFFVVPTVRFHVLYVFLKCRTIFCAMVMASTALTSDDG
jgi:hypothetical protein